MIPTWSPNSSRASWKALWEGSWLLSLNLVPAQPSQLSLGFSLEGCQAELRASTSILNTVPNQRESYPGPEFGLANHDQGEVRAMDTAWRPVFSIVSLPALASHTSGLIDTSFSQVAGPEVNVTLHSFHSQGTLGRSCQETSYPCTKTRRQRTGLRLDLPHHTMGTLSLSCRQSRRGRGKSSSHQPPSLHFDLWRYWAELG